MGYLAAWSAEVDYPICSGDLMSKFLVAVLVVVTLTGGVSQALPPEGFENFAILNKGKAHSFFEIDFTYQAPVWKNDVQSAQAMLGLASGTNLWTLGAKTQVSPFVGERSAYFIRYDLTFLSTNSFAIKYIHEEWSYIASAKEVWSGDFNFFVPWSNGASGYYMTIGYYYRWLKQRWNEDWGNPLNYNTRDQESWFQGLLGFKVGMGSSNFMTFDLNWRDNFTYYNFDNMAFDLGLHFPSPGFLFKLNGGVRTSALTMGAGLAAEYYALAGFQFN